MHISELRIRHFRSISDLKIQLDKLTVFCGPNSCGKSNVFRALQLAFQSTATVADAQDNLTDTLLGQGGPALSIWVDCKFTDIPSGIQVIAGSNQSSVTYSFRLTRTGKATRKLNAKILSAEEFEELRRHFIPIYVPPIRDLGADGLIPFKQLIRAALQRTKGPANIKQIGVDAQKLLEKKAAILLQQQDDLAKTILKAEKLTLDTSRLDIESLFEDVGLNVRIGGAERPLSALGTGHQSAVIMHLHRQLGETMPGAVLYLFEEPDNHLHPSTIRSICDDLIGISSSSQVLVSTHSPVFLGHVGFGALRPLVQEGGITKSRRMTLLNSFSERQARALLDFHGLRLTEPLLSRRVVVVEGPTDKVVLGTLFECREGSTADQADLLIISAGGKERAAELAHLLHCLGVDWRCVMDDDAIYSPDLPHTMDGLGAQQISDGIAAADALIKLLDLTTKRGKNSTKNIVAVRSELASTRPTRQHYDGSAFKKLVDKTGILSLTEQASLKSLHASKSRKKELRKHFEKARTFIWSGSLEDVLMPDSASEDCIEKELIAVGELRAPLSNALTRRTTLANKLHAAGHKPDVLSKVVRALEGLRYFKRTEVNDCYSLLFGQLP